SARSWSSMVVVRRCRPGNARENCLGAPPRESHTTGPRCKCVAQATSVLDVGSGASTNPAIHLPPLMGTRDILKEANAAYNAVLLMAPHSWSGACWDSRGAWLAHPARALDRSSAAGTGVGYRARRRDRVCGAWG